MLRGMRKASSNWLGKTIMAVVMGVLIISFGIWGIADIFRGFGQSTLATVGRTEISINEFRQLYSERFTAVWRNRRSNDSSRHRIWHSRWRRCRGSRGGSQEVGGDRRIRCSTASRGLGLHRPGPRHPR